MSKENGDRVLTYAEWEASQNFSPVSPEASSAEDAWNAALGQALKVVGLAVQAEGTDATPARIVTFISSELEGLRT